MTTLRIAAAGPMTSIQDRGRSGYRRFGVPPSGPVDRRAFAAALAAVGASADDTAIELSHGGLALDAGERPFVIAVTGAAAARIDGFELGGWCVAGVPAGARVQINVRHGNWGYVAVAGRIAALSWLGSRSTHFLAELGGGRIRTGDVVPLADLDDHLAAAVIEPPPDHVPITTARIVVGPQQRFFDDEAMHILSSGTFNASARFDRMGMVLGSPALRPVRVDMPSEPAVRGALQVDGEGRISLLTADHQTTGGYPRIAVVVEPDIDRVAQLAVGSPIRFVAVDAAEAIAITRAAAAADERWLTRIAAARRAKPSLLTANLIGGVVDALAEL
ncbi:biotin-dependent carboxyltransferase family protein [Sphingomonas sp. TZW2008]|uniref:5-oxoprolinase subunit C family protein n=1 Tax=Sphingomonas sp. TZW2008 TaxID=1917973 RepID=UPI000A26DB1C|nr:hypothetical protein [Sphingomonas sp. TZW2008]